ncbi:MAG: YvcK family protein [Thermanaerothrix sp.]|nr:YvcK family protein [Thermanaerothrix sp.]
MDPVISALIGFITGALATWGAVSAFGGSLFGGSRGGREIIASAIEHRLAMGPNIVAIGGGTGLSTLLGGLKGFTRNITAVVTVTDEGGSSGRLREEWGVLPPGDIRNCIVALAENDSALQRILSFRFDRGGLKDHSLGNLILLAATELYGDFGMAVKEMNKLLAIRGQVLPVTLEPVVLFGQTADRVVRGEMEIAGVGSELVKIWLEPRDPKPLPEVLSALESADLIVLGPGSLFTSVLPNLLVDRVAHKVRISKAPKVYVSNIMTQPGETDKFGFMDHVEWVAGVLGDYPDMVIANSAQLPKGALNRYLSQGAAPVYPSAKEEERLRASGCRLIKGDLVGSESQKGLLRHDPKKLAELLIRIAREVKEGELWRT